MPQSNRRRALIAAIALTLLFIWGNSLLPATASAALSQRVGQLLSQILHLPFTSDAGRGTLRKLAHGTEYLILGVELSLLLRPVPRRPGSLLILCGLSAALVDETIQLFVAGRAGAIRDVWIDLGGFLTGIILYLLIRQLRGRKS